MRELAERQIPLEVSLTSNIYLNFFSHLEDHPLPLLDRAGVLLTVNTDDPTLIGTTLSREYQLLIDAFGYSQADVLRIARNAFIVCSADPATKTRLLTEFDEWVAKQIK